MAEIKLGITVDDKGGVKRITQLSGATDRLDKKQKGAAKSSGDLSKGLSGVITQTTGLSPGMLGIAGATTAVVAGFVSAVGQSVELGTQLVDLRSKTGLSLQSLQELKFAGEQSGVGLDKMSDAVVRLGRRSSAELPETEKSLARIGLSIDDVLSRDPADAFALVAEKIAGIPSPADQAAVAMGIFGDSGLSILPALNQGLDENIERFRALGGVISDETLESGKALGDAITALTFVWSKLKTEIAGAVLPTLLQTADFFLVGMPAAMATTKATALEVAATLVESWAKVEAAAALLVPANQAVADSLFEQAIRMREAAAQEIEDSNSRVLAIRTAQQAQEENTTTVISASEAQGILSAATQTANLAFLQQGQTLAGLTPSLERLDAAARAELATQIDAAAGRDEHNKLMEEAAKRLAELEKKWSAEGKAANQALKRETLPPTIEWGEVQTEVNDILSEARGLMNLLGVDSDSTVGKIINGFSSAFDTLNAVLGIVDRIAGGLGGIGDLAGGLGGLFGGGGQGGGGGGLGGLLGGGLGGGLAGLGIGAAAAGIGALAGLGQRNAGDVQEEARRDLGIELPKEVAKAIAETNQPLVTFVGELAQRGFLQGETLSRELGDVFSALERGDLSKDQTQAILDQALPKLLEQIESGAVDPNSESVQRIVGAAERFGINIDALTAALGGGGAGEGPAGPGTSNAPGAGGDRAGGITIEITSNISVAEGGTIIGLESELREFFAGEMAAAMEQNLADLANRTAEKLERLG